MFFAALSTGVELQFNSSQAEHFHLINDNRATIRYKDILSDPKSFCMSICVLPEKNCQEEYKCIHR